MPQGTTNASLSFAELTRGYFGQALTVDEAFSLLLREEFAPERPVEPVPAMPALWVGSVGYEKHKDSREFGLMLRDAGVERLVDVRELPISRRRGYAKTALGQAMASVGIEYVHVRALGNPKPFRDMYKAGRTGEGREHYERYLLGEQRDALDELVEMLREKRSALMCVEHDPATCHRTVIVDALRAELDLVLEVAEFT